MDDLSIVLQSERLVGLPAKWLLLLLGLLSTGFRQEYQSLSLLTVGVIGYALLTSLLTLLFMLRADLVRRGGRTLYFVSYALDMAFASHIVYFSGGPSSEMYLLYVLLALKSVVYYPLWHDFLLFPFLSGPVYAVVLRLHVDSWYFLTESFFLLRYALLLSVVLVAVYLSWLNERHHIIAAQLRRSLDERTVDLDNKTRTMQQMATSLGDRVLELRNLQEGIKAINSALAREDVLRLIVANASQVLQGARCSVALTGDEHQQVLSMVATNGKVDALADAGDEFDQRVVQWMMEHGKPALLSDVRQGNRFAQVARLPVSSLISAPLFLDDQVIGALIATSAQRGAFTTEDLNLLSAFADQAAVAVKNARLYEQLIQEQRETEAVYQHVQERRNELEAILRGIGDGVIVADPDLNLLLMNPVATRIFRVKPDITTSMPLSDVIPHQQLISLFSDALGGAAEPIVREISLPSGGERETIYQALASPILGVGEKPRGVVTVLRDVTSQKELERMKSNFLSVVSHELKTPLHSIKGFVDIILMGKTGPISTTQADFLNTVREQTTHLQTMISDLLEFSRLESGQVKLRPTEFSLADVARAVTSKLQPLAEQGQIRLVNRIGADAPTIEADYMRIEQVLTNLVDNAIKFTPVSGSVTISTVDLGEDAQVTVADTGIGIPAPELGRIFNRFYQVDSGSTRHYRGTGLGLTICKHIVEYHGGRIWAESEEGKGSTFFFVLPKHIVAKEDQLLLDFLSLPTKEQRRKRPRKGNGSGDGQDQG